MGYWTIVASPTTWSRHVSSFAADTKIEMGFVQKGLVIREAGEGIVKQVTVHVRHSILYLS
jgi:hypothetical protein